MTLGPSPDASGGDCADRLLSASGLPRAEARLLLEHASGRRREWLLSHGEDPLGELVSERFVSLKTRRLAGEPIAYLVGEREFHGLAFAVDPSVLIPRHETELLVEEAIRRAPRSGSVIDLGTGSGAIAIAIAAARPDLTVTATDASHEALALAKRNAQRIGAAATRIRFKPGNWWQAAEKAARFDLIVSNPPYLADDDPHLSEGDLRYEPRTALASGPDGLEALRAIAAGAGDRLVPGGWLLLEHGWQQGHAVRSVLTGHGFTAVCTLRDLAGHERVTLGQAPARAPGGTDAA
jgi:release factor glutamine methyltransferase